MLIHGNLKSPYFHLLSFEIIKKKNLKNTPLGVSKVTFRRVSEEGLVGPAGDREHWNGSPFSEELLK